MKTKRAPMFHKAFCSKIDRHGRSRSDVRELEAEQRILAVLEAGGQVVVKSIARATRYSTGSWFKRIVFQVVLPTCEACGETKPLDRDTGLCKRCLGWSKKDHPRR